MLNASQPHKGYNQMNALYFLHEIHVVKCILN